MHVIRFSEARAKSSDGDEGVRISYTGCFTCTGMWVSQECLRVGAGNRSAILKLGTREKH